MKKPSASIYLPTILQRAKSTVVSTDLPFVRIVLIFNYLISCLRQRVAPWNFFQLNSTYFNTEKGIFSKLDMDDLIPEKWRLQQNLYDSEIPPSQYPVFLKPEWGQNSNGVSCILEEDDYKAFQSISDLSGIPYIVQEAGPGKQEFELYFLKDPEKEDRLSFLSVTQVINTNGTPYPINSIHNSATQYINVTDRLSVTKQKSLEKILLQIGNFRMARIGVKADNIRALLAEDFKIVEINLFLPMPLVLLTDNVSRREKRTLTRKLMALAAALVKTIPRRETRSPIFFKKLIAHYKTSP